MQGLAAPPQTLSRAARFRRAAAQTAAMSSSFLHSSSSRRGFRTLVLGLVVLAAYVAYRGAPPERGADFERARATRPPRGVALRELVAHRAAHEG